MASEQNHQSSGPHFDSGPPPVRRLLFTDISGAEEVVAQLMTSFQAYRYAVAIDITTLNLLISEVSNGMETSLNELNRDIVIMYRDIMLPKGGPYQCSSRWVGLAVPAAPANASFSCSFGELSSSAITGRTNNDGFLTL